MEFQKLLEIIKKYKSGSDYFYSAKIEGKSSPDDNRNYCDSWEIYEISSSELKKETRLLIFNMDIMGVEGVKFSQREERKADGTYWKYEIGQDNYPDRFQVGKISDKEMEKIREKGRTLVDNFKNSEISHSKNKDKCAFCNKKIDFSKPQIVARWQGNELTFCSFECSKSHNNNNPPLNDDWIKQQDVSFLVDDNSKCSVCGIKYSERKNNSWTQITFGEGPTENYCDDCSEKRKENFEIHAEQNRLDELRSQIQKPENSSKKSELEREIKERENRLSKLNKKTQLQQEIKELENKPARTPKEEQNLINKKKQLENLNNSLDNVDKQEKNWIKPTLITSGIVLVIGLIIFLFSRSKKSKH